MVLQPADDALPGTNGHQSVSLFVIIIIRQHRSIIIIIDHRHPSSSSIIIIQWWRGEEGAGWRGDA